MTTTTTPTEAQLDAVVDVLVLTEALRAPGAPTGHVTTPGLVSMALRDDGITPTPALIATVLARVEARRG
ncbi:MAG: hypothetical protein HGA44_10805 [Cellulomonadaceae bacterium]|nr:hypothetical protein [Cellulomonadaceae bacterium]